MSGGVWDEGRAAAWGGGCPYSAQSDAKMGYFQQLPFSLLLSAWLNSSLATIVAARQTSH
ncbi:hypothetical protein DXC51_06880 [Eisenbergiella massiliensis]|uniref:Uncharacterized protein n=1 Tax=Eisenbergiella massiliensis TaxID=1720294 RepID=A0A3E3I9B5_9FIRM|nr:hypothetical protein DXC51_06880 [Eisenbergiella massiliensis]